MDTLIELAKFLQEGGPWAVMALLIGAIVFRERAYERDRARYEKTLKEQNEHLTNVLVESTRQSERQAATNDKLAEVVERLERRLENVERSTAAPQG